MTPRSLSIVAVSAAVVALLVVGLLQMKGTPSSATPSRLTLAQMRARLAGSPEPFAALHVQANELLPGGLSALRARLASLRGMPIVINKWASWCEPCRDEFGVFQRVSVSFGRRVAFLGIDSGESSRAGPLEFLRMFPLSYPSYYDQSERAGIAITGSTFTPVSVFINRSGKEFIHQGPFLSVSKLEWAVRRYALEV